MARKHVQVNAKVPPGNMQLHYRSTGKKQLSTDQMSAIGNRVARWVLYVTTDSPGVKRYSSGQVGVIGNSSGQVSVKK